MPYFLYYLRTMEQIERRQELSPDNKDNQEVREFVKTIHLKLKKHKPQESKVVSLYDLITQ